MLAWSAMFCCWLIQGVAARHSLDADGVSYLNIVDSCLRGNWHALVNAYWSPGYPFLLTLWFKLFHPSLYYVPLAVRTFGVFSLLVALCCFEYFLWTLLRFRAGYLIHERNPGRFISDGSIRLAGYALFLWISVYFTPANLDQPDVWVFSLYLLASALCLQLISGKRSWLRFALLGLVLGLAYLVKAVMFPLSFTFFAGLLFYKKTWRSLPKLAWAVAVFAAVTLPFIASLSHDKGRLTYGDVGPIAYRHITDDDGATLSESGLAAAPHMQDYTRIMFLGTYPPWADPSNAYHGEPTHFHLGKQLNRIHVVWRYYFDWYAVQLGCVLCGFLVLLLTSRDFFGFLAIYFKQVALWFPAVCGFLLYGLVRVDGRFLAGFMIAVFAAAIVSIEFPDDEQASRTGGSVIITVALLLFAQVVVLVGHEAIKLPASRYPDWQVVQALNASGVKPGDHVSFMGDALSYHVWAYLGRYSLTGEIPEGDVSTFWASTGPQQREAIDWLARTGAKALVTRNAPPVAVSNGWKNVPNTDYYIFPIQ